MSKICIGAENKRKLLNKKGSLKQREELLDSWAKVAVLTGDIITVEEWKSEINSLEQKLKLSEAQIEEWRQKYVDIEKEKQELLLRNGKGKRAYEILP